ncbi:glycosyltransferase family 4 protein [Chryseobacterium taklimakanense]|uniref:glycosyltransferase family 4 protein n=1 Tax=Chryseobacterium taklimakanense TaxID=536441 RepID=UPI0023F62981|nr:glycosyltransferase family 4 protein [Chryseobacterium taklimakanense]
MVRKLTIGFISSRPLEDRKNWSGTMYSMFTALQKQGFEVVWIPTPEYSVAELSMFRSIGNFYQKIFNRGFNQHQFILKAWLASRKTKKRIKQKKIDLLFAPTAVPEIAFLKVRQPIVYLNDANVAQLLNYYSYYSGFGWVSKKITHFVEKKALENADHIVYSSDWATHFVRNFYGIPAEKLSTVKFGPNSEVPGQVNFNKDYSGDITFLFLAVFWERKGGDLALQTIELLRKKGLPAKLLVVGCDPEIRSEAMEVIPFLNKNIPAEAQKIKDFLRDSHFLFIPTKADCTPISFAEAAAYGLPVVTRDTGGVSAMVEDGITGFTLPQNSGAEEYARKIEQLLENPELAKQMSHNARKKYEQELNWKVWGEKMGKLINSLIIQVNQ